MNRVILLCGPGCCPACPEIFEDPAASQEQQIKIKDDFGATASMSRAQFSVLINSAKNGGLDQYAQE